MMLLSKAPQTRDKIRAEVAHTLGKSFDIISNTVVDHPEKLQQLPFTEAVIFETLRLFPNSLVVKSAKSQEQTLQSNGREFPIGHDFMIVDVLTDMGYS